MVLMNLSTRLRRLFVVLDFHSFTQSTHSFVHLTLASWKGVCKALSTLSTLGSFAPYTRYRSDVSPFPYIVLSLPLVVTHSIIPPFNTTVKLLNSSVLRNRIFCEVTCFRELAYLTFFKLRLPLRAKD